MRSGSTGVGNQDFPCYSFPPTAFQFISALPIKWQHSDTSWGESTVPSWKRTRTSNWFVAVKQKKQSSVFICGTRMVHKDKCVDAASDKSPQSGMCWMDGSQNRSPQVRVLCQHVSFNRTLWGPAEVWLPLLKRGTWPFITFYFVSSCHYGFERDSWKRRREKHVHSKNPEGMSPHLHTNTCLESLGFTVVELYLGERS